MSDTRLDQLNPESANEEGSIRIQTIRLSHYRFFSELVNLEINGKHLLVYGENGTGKSSLYRALALLAGQGLATIGSASNIFSGQMPEVEIEFSTGQTLAMNPDVTEIPDGFTFLKPLAIFVPLLDYKRLLRVHFSADSNPDRINIYSMLRELFRDYPAISGGTLSEIRSFPDYFKALEKLLNDELLGEINELIRIFDGHFSISSFEFSTEVDATGRPDPVVKLGIDYHETQIARYHSFLNEARLSALAISLYFASIKRLLGSITSPALKMLVLDDVLISLDMSNRLRLLEILKTRFADFQIFFFTHDKELFEIYRDKLEWAKYELYLDDSGDVPGAIIKQGHTEIERAKVFYAAKEYDACALFLRKGFERLLKGYLTPAEQRDRHCEELNLAGLVSRAISKSSGEAETILEKLDSDRKHILNPLSHNDDRNVYSQELKTAIADLGKLIEMLK